MHVSHRRGYSRPIKRYNTCWDRPIRLVAEGLKGGRWKNNIKVRETYKTPRKPKPLNKHSRIMATMSKCSDSDMLLSAKKEEGRGEREGDLHDFKWPCYPCWDQTKNTLPVSFPWSGFMWGETKGHGVSFLFKRCSFKVNVHIRGKTCIQHRSKIKLMHFCGQSKKKMKTTKRKQKNHDFKMESEIDSNLDLCCERFGATSWQHHSSTNYRLSSLFDWLANKQRWTKVSTQI